jgi:zinc protease
VYDSASCAAAYVRSLAEIIAGTAALRPAEARAFFAARYVPGNARLVVSGDFDPTATRALVESYFAGVEPGPPPETVPCLSATAKGPRTLTLTEPAATQSAAGLFYPIPDHGHADIPALELIEIILARGSFGRISVALAAEPIRPVGWQAGILGLRRAPGVFGFFGVAAPGVPADSLAAFFAAQAAWAAGEGITESELARAKQIHLATVASTMERPGDIARAAHHAAAFHRDSPPGGSPEETDSGVTLDELRRVARTYLTPDRAVTLLVSPGGAE